MPRAKHPKPYQLNVGLTRQGWRRPTGTERIGTRVVARLYDRQSGNFKAVGWLVLVEWATPDSTYPTGFRPDSQTVPLMDEFIPNYQQSTL